MTKQQKMMRDLRRQNKIASSYEQRFGEVPYWIDRLHPNRAAVLLEVANRINMRLKPGPLA